MPRTLKAWPCDATGPVEANKAHYDRHRSNPDKWGPMCERALAERRAYDEVHRRRQGIKPRAERPCDADGPVEANKAHYERHRRKPDKFGPMCERAMAELREYETLRRRKRGIKPVNEVDWPAVLKKRAETMGPEGLRAAARKAARSFGPEARSVAMKKGKAGMTAEARSAAARKANETLGPEGRRARAKRGLLTKGHTLGEHECSDQRPVKPSLAPADYDLSAGRTTCGMARAANAWTAWLNNHRSADPEDYWTAADTRPIYEVYCYEFPLTGEAYVGLTSLSAAGRERNGRGYAHNSRLVELIESGGMHTRTVIAEGLTRRAALRREWAEMERIVDEGRLALVNIMKPTN